MTLQRVSLKATHDWNWKKNCAGKIKTDNKTKTNKQNHKKKWSYEEISLLNK